MKDRYNKQGSFNHQPLLVGSGLEMNGSKTVEKGLQSQSKSKMILEVFSNFPRSITLYKWFFHPSVQDNLNMVFDPFPCKSKASPNK